MKCNDCGGIFDEPMKVRERHIEVEGYAYETFVICPYCGSGGIEETAACIICGEEQDDIICPSCVDKVSTDETVLKYSKSESEDVKLGAIFTYHFTAEQIEEILLKEMKESGKWNELKVDFLKSDYGDYLDFLEENINEI